MGHVYHARHNTMDRDVALKVLTPKLMDSPDAVARFHREIKAAAKLNHPNIVTAHDAGEQDGLHFLVMEFVDGRDLSSYVKTKGSLSLKQAIKCTIQSAQGLAYAHEQNIIHRDIKPANLLVDHQGNVKVLDMGLARFEIESENHELTDLTGTGMVMGTIDYMAPEQSLDTRTADARSDIYSLGCTFWYLLTGKSVYDGDTLMKKLLAHRENEIPSLQKMFASVPAVVDDVFQKMIAKDQTDRYQSMGEVVDALQDCLTEKSSSGSSSDLSMAVGPKLASFLADVDVPKVTSAKLEYEDSKSHTAAEQATVIGQAGDGVAPTLSRSMKAISTGKLPKWVYGVGAGVLALIVAALLIQRSDEIPEDDGPSTLKMPTSPPEVLIESMGSSEESQEISSGVIKEAEWERVGPKVTFNPLPSNHALKFDGVDDLVMLKSIVHPITKPISYEMTVFYDPPNDKPSQGQMFVAPQGSLVIGPQERPLMLLWHALESRAIVSLANSLSMEANRKYQLAASWDGATYQFFVDGKLVDQAPLKQFPVDKVQTWFAIGGHVSRSNSQGSLCFPGLIDEVRISDIARYTEDYKPVDRFVPDENTVALYHFDEGAGDVLKDSSQSGHDGAIRGAEWVRVGEDLNILVAYESSNFKWPKDQPAPAVAPFTVEDAKRHQDEWAKHLGVSIEKEFLLGQSPDGTDVKLSLILIPPGEFSMG